MKNIEVYVDHVMFLRHGNNSSKTDMKTDTHLVALCPGLPE